MSYSNAISTVPFASLMISLHLKMPLKAQDIETKLPSVVDDLVVAQGGETLVLKLRGEKALFLFDVKTRKVQTIDLGTDDFAYGAGGEVALVYVYKGNEIRSYSLKTLKLIKAKEFAEPMNFHRIVMGHSHSESAYVRISRNSDGFGQSNISNQLIDIPNLTMTKLKVPDAVTMALSLRTGLTGRDNVHYRANGNLTLISEWCSNQSPNGIILHTRVGKTPNEEFQIRGNFQSAGYLAMGDDGRLYTGMGNILEQQEPRPRTPRDIRLRHWFQSPGSRTNRFFQGWAPSFIWV
jgi:hypothetical protein